MGRQPKRGAGRARGEDGFTLIEVLIAFAILSIALTVLLGAYSNAMKRARLGEARLIASSHAQSLLAQAGVTAPIVAGETQGVFADGFGWRVKIAPYGSAEDARAWPKGAYAVTATVSWAEGTKTHSLGLASLRLGASAP